MIFPGSHGSATATTRGMTGPVVQQVGPDMIGAGIRADSVWLHTRGNQHFAGRQQGPLPLWAALDCEGTAHVSFARPRSQVQFSLLPYRVYQRRCGTRGALETDVGSDPGAPRVEMYKLWSRQSKPKMENAL